MWPKADSHLVIRQQQFPYQPEAMAHNCDPSIQEAEVKEMLFESSLGYSVMRASVRVCSVISRFTEHLLCAVGKMMAKARTRAARIQT